MVMLAGTTVAPTDAIRFDRLGGPRREKLGIPMRRRDRDPQSNNGAGWPAEMAFESRSPPCSSRFEAVASADHDRELMEKYSAIRSALTIVDKFFAGRENDFKSNVTDVSLFSSFLQHPRKFLGLSKGIKNQA